MSFPKINTFVDESLLQRMCLLLIIDVKSDWTLPKLARVLMFPRDHMLTKHSSRKLTAISSKNKFATIVSELLDCCSVDWHFFATGKQFFRLLCASPTNFLFAAVRYVSYDTSISPRRQIVATICLSCSATPGGQEGCYSRKIVLHFAWTKELIKGISC